MSRRGNCFDNAVEESFFRSLKKDRIRRRIYRSREEARADVPGRISRPALVHGSPRCQGQDRIVVVELHHDPAHSSLNDVTPAEFASRFEEPTSGENPLVRLD
jgi:transposase InsO family protein